MCEVTDRMRDYLCSNFEEEEFFNRVIEDIAATGQENVDLMRRVFDFAKNHEEHFDMTSWFASSGNSVHKEWKMPISGNFDSLKETETHCGTTMCFAGTAVWMTHSMGRDQAGTGERGRVVLGLTLEQADILFYLPNDLLLIQDFLNFMTDGKFSDPLYE